MADFSRAELLAENDRRQSINGMGMTIAPQFTKEELLAEKARRTQNEGWLDYTARKTGRGLRHASVAINSVKDLPRNLIDIGSTLITNKSFFDPKESFVQEGLDRIDKNTDNRLKARTTGEEWGDTIIPAVLPVGAAGALGRAAKAGSSFLGRNVIPSYVGSAGTAALGKKIHEDQNDPESAFYGLSPRQALVLQSLVGGAGLYAVKGFGRRLGKSVDSEALISLDEVNDILRSEKLPPIKASLGSVEGSALNRGHAKNRHEGLEKIIKGEEASPLSSFFDEHGLRETAPSYSSARPASAKNPHVFSNLEIDYPIVRMPKKAATETRIVAKEPDVSAGGPRSRLTQADKDLIAAFEKTDAGQKFKNTPISAPNDVSYSGSTFSGYGEGVPIGESNAYGPFVAKKYDPYVSTKGLKGSLQLLDLPNLRQPKISAQKVTPATPQEMAALMRKFEAKEVSQVAKSDVGPAFYKAQAEFAAHQPKLATAELPKVASPKKVIKQKNEDITWHRDPRESIELEALSQALNSPNSASAIRNFSNSLPTVEARADGARALINNLSPSGNWLEIVAKYQKFSSSAKKEILNMMMPSDRTKFAAAMHYSGRTLPHLEKEATPRIVRPEKVGALDLALGIATSGISPLVKSIAKKAEGPSRSLLNDFFHSKGLSEFARYSKRNGHASGGDVRALAAKGRGRDGDTGFLIAAQKLKHMGRDGDTDLVHVNEQEKRMLKAMGGCGSINPKTGLQEYWPCSQWATGLNPMTWSKNSKAAKEWEKNRKEQLLIELEDIDSIRQLLIESGILEYVVGTDGRSSVVHLTDKQKNGTCQRMAHANALSNSKRPQDVNDKKKLMEHLLPGILDQTKRGENAVTNFANNVSPRTQKPVLKKWQTDEDFKNENGLDVENKKRPVGTSSYLYYIGKDGTPQTISGPKMKDTYASEKAYLDDKEKFLGKRKKAAQEIADKFSEVSKEQPVLFSTESYPYNDYGYPGNHSMVAYNFKKASDTNPNDDSSALASFQISDSNVSRLQDATMNRRGSVRGVDDAKDKPASYNLTSGDTKFFTTGDFCNIF